MIYVNLGGVDLGKYGNMDELTCSNLSKIKFEGYNVLKSEDFLGDGRVGGGGEGALLMTPPTPFNFFMVLLLCSIIRFHFPHVVCSMSVSHIHHLF
jgi:hypothetical protein